MDEEIEKPSRYRSPVYSKEEVEELTNIISKYKHLILNKATNMAACNVKEAAWERVTRIFNSRGFPHIRTADNLKQKWKNLKRSVHAPPPSLPKSQPPDINHVYSQITTMLTETENINIDTPTLDEEDIDIGELKEGANNSEMYWEENSGKSQQDDSIGDDEGPMSGRSRIFNFTAKECSLLLECVRQEKQHVFSKSFSSDSNKLKNGAWERITDLYNRQSPVKRTTKNLRTKFHNMRSLARHVGLKGYVEGMNANTKKQEKLDTEPINKTKKSRKHPIKKEHDYAHETEEESDWNDNNETEPITPKAGKSICINFVPDPLSSVLNGDPGIGSTHMGSINQSDNEEVVKLKFQLLNYQMETAKIERKRIEDLMCDEAKYREMRDTETALRLRAARLDALAAEAKFPAEHAALGYTADELCARHYLEQ